jgi:hypothetical protein
VREMATVTISWLLIDPHRHGKLRFPLEHRMNVKSIGCSTQLGFLGRWLLVIAGAITRIFINVVVVIFAVVFILDV